MSEIQYMVVDGDGEYLSFSRADVEAYIAIGEKLTPGNEYELFTREATFTKWREATLDE